MPGHGHRGGGGSGNRHHRANGKIDTAGGDHQRHADRQQRHRRRAVEDINRAAEQAAILQGYLEKVRRHQAIDQQHQD